MVAQLDFTEHDVEAGDQVADFIVLVDHHPLRIILVGGHQAHRLPERQNRHRNRTLQACGEEQGDGEGDQRAGQDDQHAPGDVLPHRLEVRFDAQRGDDFPALADRVLDLQRVTPVVAGDERDAGAGTRGR